MATKRAKTEGLLPCLDGLVEDLRKLVSAAVHRADQEAVHDARVATRRLKAAMDLFDPLISPGPKKRFGGALRKLRRRLGPLRDADVMIAHMEKLARSRRLRPAAEWVAGQIKVHRQAMLREMQDKTDTAELLGRLTEWSKVRRQITRAQPKALEKLLQHSLGDQLRTFAAVADAVAESKRLAVITSRRIAPSRKGASRVAAVWPAVAGHAETRQAATHLHDPHELRIAGKALRYTLELVRADGRPLPGSVLRLFKRMQDALGLWHDHIVLTEQVMRSSLDAGLPLKDAAMQREVLTLAQEIAGRAEQRLAQFSALWRTDGRSVCQAIRQMFPPTQAVSASQTDPGQRGSAAVAGRAKRPPGAAPDA